MLLVRFATFAARMGLVGILDSAFVTKVPSRAPPPSPCHKSPCLRNLLMLLLLLLFMLLLLL